MGRVALRLAQYLPADVFREVSPQLSRLGQRMITDVGQMAQDAETNLPRLEQYDAFGHRVDRLIVANGWRQMHDVAAEEGLVATAYERKYGEHSRLVQMAMVRCRVAWEKWRVGSLVRRRAPSTVCVRLDRRCTCSCPSRARTAARWP